MDQLAPAYPTSQQRNGNGDVLQHTSAGLTKYEYALIHITAALSVSIYDRPQQDAVADARIIAERVCNGR